MADIKIRKSQQEVYFEASGVDQIDSALLKGLFEVKSTSKDETVPAFSSQTPTIVEVDEFQPDKTFNRLRMVRAGYIRPDMLKEAIERSKLHKLLQKFDEIDIPTDTGEIITVVCGLVKPDTARFVFKDCWDTEVMYDENTNEGGYYRSKGRRHVLEDIWPRIDPAWQEIIKPRLLVEEIDGVEVRYDDSLWLPSATDVFGPPKGRWWKEEPDSDQLPIFIRERGRVKECADRGTYPWQLRSILASDVPVFCSVGADGIATSYSAYGPLGFAPGFDI